MKITDSEYLSYHVRKFIRAIRDADRERTGELVTSAMQKCDYDFAIRVTLKAKLIDQRYKLLLEELESSTPKDQAEADDPFLLPSRDDAKGGAA